MQTAKQDCNRTELFHCLASQAGSHLAVTNLSIHKTMERLVLNIPYNKYYSKGQMIIFLSLVRLFDFLLVIDLHLLPFSMLKPFYQFFFFDLGNPSMCVSVAFLSHPLGTRPPYSFPKGLSEFMGVAPQVLSPWGSFTLPGPLPLSLPYF